MDNYSFEQNSIELNETIAYSLTNDTSEREISGVNDGVLGLLIIAATTIVGFRYLYLNSPFHLDKSQPIKPNLFKKLVRPNCKNCRFYNGASELSCAVHPIIASFAEAETCPDYWQRDRRKFLHR